LQLWRHFTLKTDLQFFNILNSTDVVWLRSEVLNEGDQFVPSRWETPRRLMVRIGLEY